MIEETLSAKAWSVQQQDIFKWFGKVEGAYTRPNLVVVARAGTGKTTTGVEAINHAPEQKILFCAFNKRIAEELTKKIKNPRAEAKTLHSVGYRFVMRNWGKLNLDDGRADRIARAVMGPSAPDAMIKLVVLLASKGKGMCPFPKPGDLADIAYEFDLTPDEEWEEDGWTVQMLEDYAMKCMDMACIKDGTLDFDDMVFVPVRNRWVRGSWDMVVVDEAQDMNMAQLLLAQGACAKGGRIVVIGDDRQAIYGFRGADSGSIERLKRELSAQVLPLNITYRCPKKVVEIAKAIVPDYQAAPSAPEGSITTIGSEKLAEAAGPGNFILSRKNAPLAGVCLRLLRMGKRAKIQGKEIGRGLVNLVKRIKGKSMPDFLSKLTRWEEREVKRLMATGKKSAEARCEFVHDQAETLRSLSEGLSGLAELTARITSLFEDVVGEESSFIICSSVHRAKGLETDKVFVLEDTIIRTGNIEESNIEYVAVTRAKAELVWVKGLS